MYVCVNEHTIVCNAHLKGRGDTRCFQCRCDNLILRARTDAMYIRRFASVYGAHHDITTAQANRRRHTNRAGDREAHVERYVMHALHAPVDSNQSSK